MDLSMRWEWEMIPLERSYNIRSSLASLGSLAHLSPAGLYKTILMIDRASEASAEKILVMRV